MIIIKQQIPLIIFDGLTAYTLIMILWIKLIAYVTSTRGFTHQMAIISRDKENRKQQTEIVVLKV
jgi:hypothetical protein